MQVWSIFFIYSESSLSLFCNHPKNRIEVVVVFLGLVCIYLLRKKTRKLWWMLLHSWHTYIRFCFEKKWTLFSFEYIVLIVKQLFYFSIGKGGVKNLKKCVMCLGYEHFKNIFSNFLLCIVMTMKVVNIRSKEDINMWKFTFATKCYAYQNFKLHIYIVLYWEKQ